MLTDVEIQLLNQNQPQSLLRQTAFNFDTKHLCTKQLLHPADSKAPPNNHHHHQQPPTTSTTTPKHQDQKTSMKTPAPKHQQYQNNHHQDTTTTTTETSAGESKCCACRANSTQVSQSCSFTLLCDSRERHRERERESHVRRAATQPHTKVWGKHISSHL